MTDTAGQGSAGSVGVAVPPADPQPAISAERLDVGRRALLGKARAVSEAELALARARDAQTRQMRLWHVRGMSYEDLAKASGMTRQAVQKRFKLSD